MSSVNVANARLERKERLNRRDKVRNCYLSVHASKE